MRLARLAIAFALTALPALTAAQSIDDAISARRGYFNLINVDLAVLDAMARGDLPFDAAKATAAAANLTALSGYALPGLFPARSSLNEKRGATRARPEIWSNPADFAEKFRDFQASIPVMAAAAAQGRAEIGAAMQTVGRTCVACHRGYRVRDF